MIRHSLTSALLRRLRALPARAADQRFRTRLRHDPAAPPLILSPHCDDALLNCWSVLDGGRASVVNLFTGMPRGGFVTEWDLVCGATDSAELVRERLIEDREALACAGCEPVNLPFLDAQYRGSRPLASFAAVDAAIARAVPAASAVYAPMGIRHIDHAFARRFGAAVGRSGIPVRVYAEIPYMSDLGWPEWVTGEPADPRLNVGARFDAMLARLPEIGEPRNADAIRLDPATAAAKLAALQRYRTQFPALDQGPLHAISNPAIHGFELFWPLKQR